MAHNTKRLILTLLTLAFGAGVVHAVPSNASLSGYVKATNGQPQMGAMIEVFTTAAAQPGPRRLRPAVRRSGPCRPIS